jgi:polyribonucleotide nucleotidyltransferase
VKIAANNEEKGQKALEAIRAIAMEPEEGAIYTGKVVKTTDFGAFVQLAPGTDGLVHISQLANYRVKKVTDVVKEGDIIKVKVLEVSQDGRIRLSLKATLEENQGDGGQ